LQELRAAEFGQEHVENNEVGEFGSGLGDRFFSVSGGDDLVAGLGDGRALWRFLGTCCPRLEEWFPWVLGLVSLLFGLGQGCHEGDSVRLGRAYLRKGIPARAGTPVPPSILHFPVDSSFFLDFFIYGTSSNTQSSGDLSGRRRRIQGRGVWGGVAWVGSTQ